jgi:hypothetical protein
MLNLDHRRARFRVRPVGKAVIVNMLFYVVNQQPIAPGEGQLLVFPGEIVFDMTLGANIGAHFLARGFRPINPLLLQGVDQGWPGQAQRHRFRIMAVGARGADVQLIFQIIVGCAVKLFPAHFGD